MSVTNPYFNHYNAQNEQDLIQSMVDEQIFTQGLPVYYIPRTENNIEFIYSEDPTAIYNSFEVLAMYPINVEGFGGDDTMSFFAHEFPDTCEFIVSKKKFHEKFPDLPKPQAGDLLYMTVTNAFLEIKFCEEESQFFQRGNVYVYELKTVAFDYSYEDMATGDATLDYALAEMDILNPDINTEEFGDNDEFETEYDSEIEFDPNNPFGTG